MNLSVTLESAKILVIVVTLPTVNPTMSDVPVQLLHNPAYQANSTPVTKQTMNSHVWSVAQTGVYQDLMVDVLTEASMHAPSLAATSPDPTLMATAEI